MGKEANDEIILKSAKIYWNPDDQRINSIINDGCINITNLNNDEINYLIKELDRRLIQLWDKIAFEREQQLVNYDKLKNSNKCC